MFALNQVGNEHYIERIDILTNMAEKVAPMAAWVLKDPALRIGIPAERILQVGVIARRAVVLRRHYVYRISCQYWPQYYSLRMSLVPLPDLD